MVAMVISSNVNQTTMTGPTGWVASGAIRTFPSVTGSVRVFTKVAGGAEPATYTFTFGTADNADLLIQNYSGVDNTTPEDVSSLSNNGDSVPVVALSLTTVTNNAFHLCWYQQLEAFTGFPTAGYTSRIAQTGNFQALMDKAISPAGATGNQTVTSGAATQWISWSMALRPAAAGVAGKTWPERVALQSRSTSYTR